MKPLAVRFSKYCRTNGEPFMRILQYTPNGVYYRICYPVKIVAKSKLTKFDRERRENMKPGIQTYVITNRCTIQIARKKQIRLDQEASSSDIAAKWIAFMINNSTRFDPHLWGEFDANITEFHADYSASDRH